MPSPTWWTWIWASSGKWWRTRKLGLLQCMGLQRGGRDWGDSAHTHRYKIFKENKKHTLKKKMIGVQLVSHVLLYSKGIQLRLLFSRSVVSDSLWPHELQHTRPPCPSPTSGVYSNSCPLSRWCHPTILSSVIPFSCPQSFPASGFFQINQLFTWGGQSIGVSASTSVLPMNSQDWSPLGWTGWISLVSKGLSRVFSNSTVQKHQFFGTQPSLWSNSHIHTWLLGKP